MSSGAKRETETAVPSKAPHGITTPPSDSSPGDTPEHSDTTSTAARVTGTTGGNHPCAGQLVNI